MSARAPSEHYENFPVASWLCPPHLRPAVAAIYWFARTADDLADEGSATAEDRLNALHLYRTHLDRCASPQAIAPPPWTDVFLALGRAIRDFALPLAPMHALLDAFEQDVRYTAQSRCYATRAELRDYCARSANPVGRLMLHLFGLHDRRSVAESDQICTALQLINFWQDLAVDTPRRRFYVPQEDAARFGLVPQDVAVTPWTPQRARLVAALSTWAREEMQAGAALALRVPGRMGLELRLVVQGGLRILEKLAACDFNAVEHRPRIRWHDMPSITWRAMFRPLGPSMPAPSKALEP